MTTDKSPTGTGGGGADDGDDLEMMQELGYCSGIENYSRYLSGRAAGDAPPPAGVRGAAHPARGPQARGPGPRRRPLAQGGGEQQDHDAVRSGGVEQKKSRKESSIFFSCCRERYFLCYVREKKVITRARC